MTQMQFGSLKSTGKKLDVLGEYLAMYQLALSGIFETMYIDAFAGTGEVPIGSSENGLLDMDVETKDVIAGSATRAISVSPPFHKYYFIDNKVKRIDALKNKFKNDANFDRSEFICGDANAKVQSICESENWKKRRGVVFLDPFGSQVNWETIEKIAETKALDLWYLFPAGLSVFRQISSDGTIDPTHEPSLNRIFGNEKWKTAFLKPSTQGELFETKQKFEKNVTAESAADYMIEQMSKVFRGGVLKEKIPLGKHAYPSYYLLFAWGNESPKAKILANKLSKAAIKATDRKYGRLI